MRRPVLFVLLTAFAAGISTAGADQQVVSDPDDSTGRLDIKEVQLSHVQRGVIRLMITFHEPPEFTPATDEGGDFVVITLDLEPSVRDRYKDILVQGNPDGGLYGVLRSTGDATLSYVRVWRESEVAIGVEFTRSQLTRGRLAKWADWFVDTSYYDPEECDDPTDVTGLCFDGAGPKRHRFGG